MRTDDRPCYLRPKRVLFVMAIIFVVALSVSHFVLMPLLAPDIELTPNDLAAGSQVNPSMTVTRQLNEDEVIGVPQYGADQAADNRAALQTRAYHPWHYNCRRYPADEKLTQADLIPTANVVVIIRFNKKTGQYEATKDPRVLMRQWDTTSKNNGTPPVPMTTFEWKYTGDVVNFTTYGYRNVAGTFGWGGAGMHPNAATNTYRLYTDRSRGAQEPMFAVIATDTTTCDRSPTPLPEGFDWEGLARDDLLQPSN